MRGPSSFYLVLVLLNLDASADIDGIVVGARNSCFVSNGSLYCTGENQYGQATNASGFNGKTILDSSRQHLCVSDNDGLWCTGRNQHGQTDVPVNLGPISDIALGSIHTCVVSNQKVQCWGANGAEQSSPPDDLENVTEIAAESELTCAIAGDEVRCWGRTFEGASRSGFANPKLLAVGDRIACVYSEDKIHCWSAFNDPTITAIENVSELSAMGEEICAVVGDRVYCWQKMFPSTLKISPSYKNPRQLAVGSRRYCLEVSGEMRCYTNEHTRTYGGLRRMVNATDLEISNDHVCTVDEIGVHCWGGNNYNKLAVDFQLAEPRLVSTADNYSCAVDGRGVRCWGERQYTVVVPKGLAGSSALDSGGNVTCAITRQQELKCWAGAGRLETPEVVLPTHVSYGLNHGCVIDHFGVLCWGNNYNGQLHVPEQLSNPIDVSAGNGHSCAIDSELGVLCWGSNKYGQSDPPPILSNPKMVAAGSSHSCALDDNGVVCWGEDAYGKTSVPVLSNPTFVAAGAHLSCAIDDFGPICWGINDQGQTNVVR